jgi:hypothetical protein
MIPSAFRAYSSAARHSASVDRWISRRDGSAAHGLRRVMPKPYFIAGSKGKPPRTAETVDVAARHLLYKLYDATSRVPGAWPWARSGATGNSGGICGARMGSRQGARRWRQGRQDEECGADGRRAKGGAYGASGGNHACLEVPAASKRPRASPSWVSSSS